MAIRHGGRLIDVPGVPSDSVEDISYRSERGTAFITGTRSRNVVCSLFPIHINTPSGWVEPDLRPKESPGKDKFGASCDAYSVSLGKSASHGMSLDRLGVTVSHAPLSLSWRNDKKEDKISNAIDKGVSVSLTSGLYMGGYVKWEGVFGTGSDLYYHLEPGGVRKQLILSEAPKAPQKAMVDGSLQLSVEFSFDCTEKVKVNGVIWDKISKAQTNKLKIEKNSGDLVWDMPTPIVFDSDGRVTSAVVIIDNKGSGRLSIEVPYTFLSGATYPVTVDPSYQYATITSGDALIYGAGTDYSAVTANAAAYIIGSPGGVMAAGQNKTTAGVYALYRSYLRFLIEGIPSGSTKTSVNMWLTPVSDQTVSDFVVTIKERDFEAIDASSFGRVYTSGAYAPSDKIWRDTSGISVGVAYPSQALSVDYIQDGVVSYSLASANEGIPPTGKQYLGFGLSPSTAPYLVINTLEWYVTAYATTVTATASATLIRAYNRTVTAALSVSGLASRMLDITRVSLGGVSTVGAMSKVPIWTREFLGSVIATAGEVRIPGLVRTGTVAIVGAMTRMLDITKNVLASLETLATSSRVKTLYRGVISSVSSLAKTYRGFTPSEIPAALPYSYYSGERTTLMQKTKRALLGLISKSTVIDLRVIRPSTTTRGRTNPLNPVYSGGTETIYKCVLSGYMTHRETSEGFGLEETLKGRATILCDFSESEDIKALLLSEGIRCYLDGESVTIEGAEYDFTASGLVIYVTRRAL